MSSAGILAEKDANTHNVLGQQQQQPLEADGNKPKSMEYHRQMLESKLKNGGEQPTYISPSDNIQSPATQKLNNFRNKALLKKTKPQTLFAKTSTRNMEAANNNGGQMFADIPKEDQ